MQQSTLKIVVLAAGYSTRLGRPKALAKIRGVSLIRRTIATLQSATRHRVVIVIPPRAVRLRAELRGCRVSLLDNPLRDRGLSASVVLALRRTRWSAGTLLLPVDLAFLAPMDIRRLIDGWHGARRRVVGRSAEGRAATPVILPRRFYPRVSQLTGDVGLRDFVSSLQAEQKKMLELPSAAYDIDTSQQLAAARKRRQIRC